MQNIDIDALTEECESSDKFDGPDTLHYWSVSLNGDPGESLLSNENDCSGSELHSVTDEERQAFKTDAPFFLLQWNSQGFVSGRFVTEKEADQARSEAEEDNGPNDGDYSMADARDGISVAQHLGRHVGIFADRDAAERAIREHAGGSFFPNVWFCSEHGNMLLLRDFDWKVA